MNTFARLQDNAVVELIEVPSDQDISALFHPEFVATCKPCASTVEVGWLWSGKKFVAPIEVKPPIEDLRAAAKQSIDQRAEDERLKYLTPGIGQAMTYQQKADEALRYASAQAPNPADFPLLNAEVGITAPTLAEVAETVRAAFSQWLVIGSQIESVRLRAKASIEAAGTIEAVQEVMDAIVWPSF